MPDVYRLKIIFFSGIHIKRNLPGIPEKTIIVKGVRRDINNRYGHSLANGVGTGHDLVPERRSLLSEPLRLGSQHQVGKVDVPLMWRYIRALGHVAKVAQVTLVHDLVVIILIDPIDLHGVVLVHQAEQGRKGITQADAAPTAMADIKNTL